MYRNLISNSAMLHNIALFSLLLCTAHAAEVLVRNGAVVIQVAEGKTVNIATDADALSADNIVVTQVGKQHHARLHGVSSWRIGSTASHHRGCHRPSSNAA